MKPQSHPLPSEPASGGQRGLRASILVLLFSLILPGTSPADLRTSLDRTQVYQGDTLTLSIEVDGTSAPPPDLSPLTPDFEVLATTSGTQISIVNGRRSDTTRWQISLRPRRAGDLRIPPLSIGTEHTRPLTLRVADTANIPQRDAEVLVELQADLPKGTAYVQQQVPLMVRLYSAVPLRQGSLSDPQVANAVLERLGEDKRYTTERGGKRFQVIERRYSLSPEQSGPLQVPPVVFKGNLPAERGSRSARSSSPFDQFRDDPFFERFFEGSTFDRFFDEDPFAVFEAGRPVTVRSQGLEIQVKPKPATSGGSWLPAEDLAVEDSWAGKAPELRVGEPVTRTLTLRARGLSGSQIPQVPLAGGDSVRVYPESPRNDTRTDGNLIYGTSQQVFALIPQRAGELRLPEIRLKWWDLRSDQEREAIIPAITASVLPAAQGAVETESTAKPAPNGQSTAAAVSGHPAAHDIQAPPPANAESLGLRPWLIGAAILALVAASASWLLNRWGRGTVRALPLAKAPKPEPAPARRAFLAACGTHDPAAAARTLLAWAAVEWPADPPRSLAALAADLAEGGEAVLALERVLYAREGSLWNGAGLKEALALGLRRRMVPVDEATGEGLAPLYPRRV